jgi:hypothetical protein
MPRFATFRDRVFGSDVCCGDAPLDCSHLLMQPGPLSLAFLHFSACVLFLAGSVMFLPEQDRYFANGCQLFATGSGLLLFPQASDLHEVVQARSADWHVEAVLNFMYLLGSLLFFIGSFLFEFYTEESAPYFEAVMFFIFASCGYVLALLGNSVLAACSAPPIDAADKRAQRARGLAFLRMNADMLGCCAFLAGSFLYLPQVGCGDATFEVGAWLFIIGSALILLGSIFSLVTQVRRYFGRARTDQQRKIIDFAGSTELEMSGAEEPKDASGAANEASSATV